jgi:hypothetical protein
VSLTCPCVGVDLTFYIRSCNLHSKLIMKIITSKMIMQDVWLKSGIYAVTSHYSLFVSLIKHRRDLKIPNFHLEQGNVKSTKARTDLTWILMPFQNKMFYVMSPTTDNKSHVSKNYYYLSCWVLFSKWSKRFVTTDLQ